MENVENVDNDTIIGRLSAHRLLSTAPPDEIRWLADRGTLKRFETDDVLATSSEPLEAMHIVLSGGLALTFTPLFTSGTRDPRFLGAMVRIVPSYQ